MMSTATCKAFWSKTRSAATSFKAVEASANCATLCKGVARVAESASFTTGSRSDDHQIYMLVVYPKSKKDSLTDKELSILRELVKEL